MNGLYLKLLPFFMLNAYVIYGLPMYNPSQSTQPQPTQIFAATHENLNHHGRKEAGLATNALDDHFHHENEYSKEFFLNPAKYHHKNEMKKSLNTYNHHCRNGDEILKAQHTGAFKLTKSKSGNHDHYNAILPGKE